MNRKFIVSAVAAGFISFLGAFAAGWLTKPHAAGAASGPQAQAADQVASASSPPILMPTLAPAGDESSTARSLSEQQLKELIFEVRENIQEYDRKLLNLDKEKERLQIAQQTLKKDIEALNNLHTEMAASIVSLKNEREMLLKARVGIEQVERSNLVAIAAAYDKMDPVQAGEILMNMVGGTTRGATVARNTNPDDAVKILHFMQDRTKANVLAELATREPAQAAMLCQRLKLVQEGK